ncbi:Eef1A Lysine And N-Terminal Methyltransferase [Manis pentadactyla]|nr:Eef1A Lysine And N-Terminal Methyltransferase [Manis pentadactyla]
MSRGWCADPHCSSLVTSLSGFVAGPRGPDRTSGGDHSPCKHLLLQERDSKDATHTPEPCPPGLFTVTLTSGGGIRLSD